MLERRSELREQSRAVYRAAYVRSSRGLKLVTMKNASPSGAAFHGEIDLQIGDRIEFCTGNEIPTKAEIRWVGNSLFGVEFDKAGVSRPAQVLNHNPRSVRLPIGCEAAIYIEGKKHCSQLINLSQFGACVIAPKRLAPGQLISVQIGSHNFDASTVRWAVDGKAGVKFAKPLSPSQINALLDTIASDEELDQPPEKC